MSPIGLLAVLFAVVTFGGGALVFLYDMVEARTTSRRSAVGERSARRLRPTPAAVRQMSQPRGLVVTVRAGAQPASRGEAGLSSRH